MEIHMVPVCYILYRILGTSLYTQALSYVYVKNKYSNSYIQIHANTSCNNDTTHIIIYIYTCIHFKICVEKIMKYCILHTQFNIF